MNAVPDALAHLERDRRRVRSDFPTIRTRMTPSSLCAGTIALGLALFDRLADARIEMAPRIFANRTVDHGDGLYPTPADSAEALDWLDLADGDGRRCARC